MWKKTSAGFVQATTDTHTHLAVLRSSQQSNSQRNKVFLEKVTVALKKPPAFYGTRGSAPCSQKPAQRRLVYFIILTVKLIDT
jgi:hypothetical protein